MFLGRFSQKRLIFFENLCQHKCREVVLGYISKGLGRFREVMLMGVLLFRPLYVKNVPLFSILGTYEVLALHY